MTPTLWLAAFGAWLLLVWWLRRRELRTHAVRRTSLDLAAGGLLFLLTLGFFWRVVSGDVYQPADGGDLVSFLYPTYRFAARTLAQGELPLWNPHLYAGAPFISDIQAGFLYLPNLLLFLLQPAFDYPALQWMVIAHFFWAGLGMYVLLRTLRWAGEPLVRPAALLGALAFEFSDPLLIHVGNLNLVAVLSWLPWVMAAFALALEKGSLGWAAGAGLLLAVGSYAGHAQSSLYIGLALILYAAFWGWNVAAPARAEGAAGRAWWARPVLALATTLLIGGLLVAPILLPALQLTGYTARSDFVYQDAIAFSLAPTQAIGLLTPGFFGRGPALHWGLWDRAELPYTGVATLILAGAALLLATPALRRRLWPWVGIGLFGLVTALGIYAILHGWLTVLLPGFAQFRAPARASILWAFAVSVLAAVGLHTLYRGVTVAEFKPLRRGLQVGALVLWGVVLPLSYLTLLLTQENETAFLRASVAALALVLAAVFWLATWALIEGRTAGWWSPEVFGALMIGLLFLDLSATGAYTDISPTDPARGFTHPEITAFLTGDPDLFRIDTRTDIQDLWQPDSAALVGVEDVGGIVNPLGLRAWDALWEATGGRQTPRYDMLNAKYVIVRDGTPLPEGKFTLALDAPGDLAVYRNTTALPRAWLVHEATLAADNEAALAATQAEEFDPAQQVVLVSDTLPPTGDAGGVAAPVTTQRQGSRALTLDVNAAAPGVLVVSEMWYPGWQATVNGAPAEVMQANGGLQAVAVPAGQSQVVLSFHPAPWRWGLIAAAVGVALVVLLLVLERRRIVRIE